MKSQKVNFQKSQKLPTEQAPQKAAYIQNIQFQWWIMFSCAGFCQWHTLSLGGVQILWLKKKTFVISLHFSPRDARFQAKDWISGHMFEFFVYKLNNFSFQAHSCFLTGNPVPLFDTIKPLFFHICSRRSTMAYLCSNIISSVPLRTRRALMLFNNALLRTRRVLSP